LELSFLPESSGAAISSRLIEGYQSSISLTFRATDFTRVPKAVKSAWGEMAATYLAKRRELVLSIQIVDSRHEPTTLDLQLNEWLTAHARPRLVVATKSDKLSNNELRKNVERIRRKLVADEVAAYSAMTGRERDEVWRIIKAALDF
jgi:GTP-binding protein